MGRLFLSLSFLIDTVFLVVVTTITLEYGVMQVGGGGGEERERERTTFSLIFR